MTAQILPQIISHVIFSVKIRNFVGFKFIIMAGFKFFGEVFGSFERYFIFHSIYLRRVNFCHEKFAFYVQITELKKIIKLTIRLDFCFGLFACVYKFLYTFFFFAKFHNFKLLPENTIELMENLP